MFTGLVEEKATVERIDRVGESCRVAIHAPLASHDVRIGDSICVNGCCLTVVVADSERLEFDAVAETLRRTNLGELKVGSSVNIERSLKPDSRLGGHYVSGHVDGLGHVRSRIERDSGAEFRFGVPEQLTRQMASKGSVTVDGISLTLVEVNHESFTVAVIPHTLAVTTLGDRREGDSVNIETDLLAKYVERQLVCAGVIGE